MLARMVMATAGVDPQLEIIGFNWGETNGAAIHLYKYENVIESMTQLAEKNGKELRVEYYDSKYDVAWYTDNDVRVFALVMR